MGYPMTYQRLIHRNGLAEGDYGQSPPNWPAEMRLAHWGFDDEFCGFQSATALAEAYRNLYKARNEANNELARRVRMLVGDLRRLERDGQDEIATAKYIGHRLEMNVDFVALVLKEFLNF